MRELGDRRQIGRLKFVEGRSKFEGREKGEGTGKVEFGGGGGQKRDGVRPKSGYVVDDHYVRGAWPSAADMYRTPSVYAPVHLQT